jgi:hypothetical protein
MEQVLDEYFKSKDGEELTFVDKQEVYDFMQTTQTAMVCLLLISAIVQFCTIALSAGEPITVRLSAFPSCAHARTRARAALDLSICARVLC